MRFFRIYHQTLGGHTHTRWFAGKNPAGTFGKCGDLTFDVAEFDALRRLLRHAQVEFIAEG